MRLSHIAFPAGLAALLVLGSQPAVLAQAGKNEKRGGGQEKKSSEKDTEKKGKTEEKEKKQHFDLDVQATLGAPAKGGGDFYDLSYTETEGKKAVRKKAWLKIDSATNFLRDRAVGVEAFKEGESLRVFGKPVERESGGAKGTLGGKNFRLIQASRVVFGGKSLSVNENYGDPKDKKFQWCEVTVEKPGAGLTVTYQGGSYKLTLEKGAAVLQRLEGDLKRDARKGARLIVKANAVSEKPPGEEDRPVFKAEQAIVMEPGALKWYSEALLP